VAETANERDIKRAYRQKALKLHPDVNKAVRVQADCVCRAPPGGGGTGFPTARVWHLLNDILSRALRCSCLAAMTARQAVLHCTRHTASPEACDSCVCCSAWPTWCLPHCHLGCPCLLQPNAEAQFLEVKNAFTVLSDPQQRAAYDRQLRGVSAVACLQAALVCMGPPCPAGAASSAAMHV
jgi:hypothetical protein